MSIEYDHLTVADSDFQIRGGGGHPDPGIRGAGFKKRFFRPFGPQFGLKIRGSRALRPPWIRHCIRTLFKIFRPLLHGAAQCRPVTAI